MSKLFAVLALLLIASGIILLAVPKPDPQAVATRSLAPQAEGVASLVAQARDVAEFLNAPLSIAFGLASLMYSRRSYHLGRAAAERSAGKT